MAVLAKKNIGILTSGGDAQGMNAAVRAVVRCAIGRGVDAYAIIDGYQGMVDGTGIVRMNWEDVSGIMDKGGTAIGTARCKEFREREGLKKAACNLVCHDISRLVVIGGDGSLSGANEFSKEWSSLTAELVSEGRISAEQAQAHPVLEIVGLVGSIDNDMSDTDVTIGTDSALHRITDAVDALTSTAASHQRTFVVEVMGRNCGYLALASSIATGASWVLIPEMPPEAGWEEKMCQLISSATKAGRRDSIVIVAEGARDREGKPISSTYVRDTLENMLKRDVRLTILGHVQRGGTPSAFDRTMPTALGYRAVNELLAEGRTGSSIVGMQKNHPCVIPLVETVEKTRSVATEISNGNYERAVQLRGPGFRKMLDMFSTLVQAVPENVEPPNGKRYCFAVMNAGRPAAGMNPAIRAAVRIAMNAGHKVIGINDGFSGLIDGNIREFDWMSVENLIRKGGTALGTSRHVPRGSDFYMIAKNLEKFNINGLMIIGGWAGYETAYELYKLRKTFPAFNIPVVCIPATINNNMPGSELSIGADTALNTIVEAIDKIKHSSDGSRRVFIVEVMGRFCGYLAAMSGLATGAEIIYTHEEGITLDRMRDDINVVSGDFRRGRRIALIVRNENANKIYSTDFIASLFEEDGGELFDVRKSVLGPMQQGGNPTPFDRIQATRLAYEGINFLIAKATAGSCDAVSFGLQGGNAGILHIKDLPEMAAMEHQRPMEQWWLPTLKMSRQLATKPDDI